MWPINRKFPAFPVLLLLFGILLALFTITLYKQDRVSRERERQVIVSYEILRTGRLIMTNVLNMETGQRGYLLSGDRQFLKPYIEGREALDQTFSKGESLLAGADAETRAKFNEIRPKVDKVVQILVDHLQKYDQRFDKSKRGQYMLTISDMLDTKAAMDDLRAAMDEFLAAENLKLHRGIAAAHQQQTNYTWVLVAGAMALFGTLILSGIMLFAMRVRTTRVESDLEYLREGYTLMIENMNDGTYDYNPATGVLIFSPSHERLLGYKPSELPNRVETINNLLHPDDYNATWDTANKYMRQEIPDYSVTFRLLHKNGEWRWILSRGVGVWDKEGNIRRMVGIHTDITAQKQREEELRQLNEELESFAYIASHDLRGPLINIKGFSGEVDYMLGQLKTRLGGMVEMLPVTEQQEVSLIFDKEVPEAMGFIRSAVDKMDKLTTAILDLSRIGRRDYKIEEVDSNALAHETINSLAYEIAKKNISVEYRNLPRLQTDEVALQQIIGNIVDNAVKFMDASRPGKIVISAELVPGAYEFSIADNGTGISDMDKKKIFDIFRRGANARDTRGLGMGMAYVKATLRRLGGRVWFTSETEGPQQGTVFYFTIPFDSLKGLHYD